MSRKHPLFAEILRARGLEDEAEQSTFLSPIYGGLAADPYLLPDMLAAVQRLLLAQKNAEQVVIYGDYDIDGLSATALLLDAFASFGIAARAFIPNRFSDGYGLSGSAIKKLADEGVQLLVSVDCGTLSHNEIDLASSLGVDAIVTDHHAPGDSLPAAVAVINPKRADSQYPFDDFAGVGVAYKLVQAMQAQNAGNLSTHSTRLARSGLSGLALGQEKWLLDLVALGTICDVVKLTGENRELTYWGLQVLQKTRRPGLRALMAVAAITPESLNARAVGFGLGPRLNASGRLETAQLSLELLSATDNQQALKIAEQLDSLNTQRRADQARIVKAAEAQAEHYADDAVLVLSAPDWSHGIVGIVAAKMLEKFHKPTFVLQELGDETKGSARSFGDFSAVDAVRACEHFLLRGGGHAMAAGVTLRTEHIGEFRAAINDYYLGLKLTNQHKFFDPQADAAVENLQYVDEQLAAALETLQPYGHGNSEPILHCKNLAVRDARAMGSEGQHVRLSLEDGDGRMVSAVGFNVPAHYHAVPGQRVELWCNIGFNEWRGSKTVQATIRDLKVVDN